MQNLLFCGLLSEIMLDFLEMWIYGSSYLGGMKFVLNEGQTETYMKRIAAEKSLNCTIGKIRRGDKKSLY